MRGGGGGGRRIATHSFQWHCRPMHAHHSHHNDITIITSHHIASYHITSHHIASHHHVTITFTITITTCRCVNLDLQSSADNSIYLQVCVRVCMCVCVLVRVGHHCPCPTLGNVISERHSFHNGLRANSYLKCRKHHSVTGEGRPDINCLSYTYDLAYMSSMIQTKS